MHYINYKGEEVGFTEEDKASALSMNRDYAVTLLNEKSWGIYEHLREILASLAKTQKLPLKSVQFILVCNNPKSVCFYPQDNLPLTFNTSDQTALVES